MMQPYYQDKYVQIFLGDCREILPELSGGGIDLMLTDPPYGINKGYSSWDTEFILPPDIVANALGLMCGVWNILKCPATLSGMTYRWQLIAHLVNGMTNGAIGFGNYIPCLVYVKDGLSLHRKESDCKDFVVGLEDKPNHPSPKPERPIAWFIERLSSPGQMILDPFLGSGTTAYCAKKLQRRCIGIEIEEKYCEIAARRCQQEVMELNIIETVEQQNPLGLEI